MEKAKESLIYKKVLETFSDAELVDIEKEKENNDWFYKDYKSSQGIRIKNKRKPKKKSKILLLKEYLDQIL